MEDGLLRYDLNVAIAPLEEKDNEETSSILDRTGNRVEVKNLNSIRQVQQAAEYEAVRQAEAVVNGDPTSQETRTFDVRIGKTVVIRTKGGAKDYRFMPEPDLPPIVLNTTEVSPSSNQILYNLRTKPNLDLSASKRFR